MSFKSGALSPASVATRAIVQTDKSASSAMAQRAAIMFASTQNQEQYANQPRSSNENSNALHGILNNKDDEDSEMVFEGDVVKSGSVWKLCSGGRHDWQERYTILLFLYPLLVWF